MAYSMNDGALDSMLRAAVERGWRVDDWFRDDGMVRLQYDLYDHPRTPGYLTAMDAGDVCAWFRMSGEFLSVVALGPLKNEGQYVYHSDEMKRPGTKSKLLDGYITKWTAGHVQTYVNAGFAVGQRLFCIQRHTREVHLAVAVDVDENGKILSVLYRADGQLVDVTGADTKWFSMKERDAAFDDYWSKGRTQFAGYMSFRGAMFQRQRLLAKKSPEAVPEAIIHDRKGNVVPAGSTFKPRGPDKPEPDPRAMYLDPAQRTPRQIERELHRRALIAARDSIEKLKITSGASAAEAKATAEQWFMVQMREYDTINDKL